MSKRLIVGIDEAGRGPALGPMIICGIKINVNTYGKLKSERIRDSKKIGPERREEFAKILKKKAKEIEFVKFGPKKIDKLRKNNINLNSIEAIGFAKILNRLNPKKAYLDSASANIENFSKEIKSMLKIKDLKLIIEHKADINHVPVSAASILAKVKRDSCIKDLKKKYGETGSGYPADSRTTKFLRKWVAKNKKLPSFARKTWKTCERILEESK